MARQYFLDMENETPATYDIECIGDHSSAPSVLTGDQLATRIAAISRFIPSALERTIVLTDELLEKANEFMPFDPLNQIFRCFHPQATTNMRSAHSGCKRMIA
jgi:hypothetical protein